jgi:DNA-binding MarR family transcriptional regulator
VVWSRQFDIMSADHAQTSTDRLVDKLAGRLRVIDLVGWRRIVTYADQAELSLADLRLLFTLAIEDRPMAASELAELSGLPLGSVYSPIHRLHGRGYAEERHRRHSLTDAGRQVVADLEQAHREGIRAYVAELDADERRRLKGALGVE